MGTRSVVAIPSAEGWKGRYVHWDGYPTGVGEDVRTIVLRDGYTKAVDTLIHQHTRWSSINPDTTGNARHDVVGYGSAADDEPAESFVTSTGDHWGTEWCYVLHEAGITVHERNYVEGGWVNKGTIRYDDTKGMEGLK